ncbi:MAG: SIS domain-containing protein [Rhodospirillaceae bacterium]|nr:SIS domain-containing protein [Rhodospirillaceae bacterium]
MIDLVTAAIDRHRDALTALEGMAADIVRAGETLIAALAAGRTAFFCGNGGSAADAAHLAGELSGRYLRERAALPAMALGMNPATLTAIANDYGYDQAFARELDGLARPGDVLVALSTSGASPSVLRALETARAKGLARIGLTGPRAGAMTGLCDVCLNLPGDSTPRIQEMHKLVGHILCDLAERTAAPAQGR